MHLRFTSFDLIDENKSGFFEKWFCCIKAAIHLTQNTFSDKTLVLKDRVYRSSFPLPLGSAAPPVACRCLVRIGSCFGFRFAGGSGERSILILWSSETHQRVVEPILDRLPTPTDAARTAWKWDPRAFCRYTPARSPHASDAFDHLQRTSLAERYVSIKLRSVVGV